MNIINTLKNYFKNNINKINMSLTSTDNILLKEKTEMLDLKLKEIENLLQGQINFSKIRHYSVTPNENFYTDALDLCVTNNMALFSGLLYSKTQLNGEYHIDLPINVRPKTGFIGSWTHVISDGTPYRFHIQVERNAPSRLLVFSYDTLPQNTSIPFNLIYALDDLPN